MRLPDWAQSLQFRLTLGFGALLALMLFIVSGWAAFSTRSAIEAYGEDLDRFREERTRELVEEIYDASEDLMLVQYSLQQAGKLFSLRIAAIDNSGYVIADSHKVPWSDKGDYETEDQRFEHHSKMRTLPVRLGSSTIGKLVFMDATDKGISNFYLSGRGPRQGAIDDSIFSFGKDVGEGSKFGFDDASAAGLLLDITPEMAIDPGSMLGFGIEDDQRTREFIDGAFGELSVEPQLSALEKSFQRSIFIAGIAGISGGILLVALFTRQALSPVRNLSAAALRLGKGDFKHRVEEDRRDELGQLASTFNTMATELEQMESNRRRLTADIAHELRTPLTNIRGYLEAIKDGVLKPEEGAIDTLHKETLHLSALVEDLRLLAVADAGTLRLELQPDRIDSVVESAVEPFMPRALEKGVELKLKGYDSLPLVMLDRTRMTQIVSNLLENALNHTSAGGVVSVSLDMSGSGEMVRLRVWDTGSGIPSEDVDKVFDEFFRVDASRTRGTGGAGLGLTIVKRLVDAHNGEISAESTFGDGSTFTVLLPIAGDNNDAE